MFNSKSARGRGALVASALISLSQTCGLPAVASPLAPADKIEMQRFADVKDGHVIVIAHRACWKETMEDSVAAVRACLEMGADGVEFDVRHTKDGIAVIMHDETVDRTTSGHGRVDQLTLAQLKTLRLRRGHGGPQAATTNETVPTLMEYLKATEGRLWLVFDVKDLSQEESFSIAKSAGVGHRAIYFYECGNTLLLNHIKSFWNDVVVFPISFETDGPLSKSISSCSSNPKNLIHTKWRHPGFLEEATQLIKTRNERVWIATMFPDDVAGKDDQLALTQPNEVWGRQIKAGANMIMTNEPKPLLDYLHARDAQRAHESH